MLFLRYLGALCPGLWGYGVSGERRLSYSITWFCSWSPCADCSLRLAQFLSQMPNLRLRIFVSRLYFCDMEDSREREGLRMLKKAGVHLTVMSYKGNGINLCICGRNVKREQTMWYDSRATNELFSLFFPFSSDFFYCWQTFVARKQSKFKAWDELHQNSVRLARKLDRILQVEDLPYSMFFQPTTKRVRSNH